MERIRQVEKWAKGSEAMDETVGRHMKERQSIYNI